MPKIVTLPFYWRGQRAGHVRFMEVMQGFGETKSVVADKLPAAARKRLLGLLKNGDPGNPDVVFILVGGVGLDGPPGRYLEGIAQVFRVMGSEFTEFSADPVPMWKPPEGWVS